jgi:hypothetical protein
VADSIFPTLHKDWSWVSPGKIGQVAWLILNDASHRRVALSSLQGQYVDFVDFLNKQRFAGDSLRPFLTSKTSTQFHKNEFSYEIIVRFARPWKTHRAGCVAKDFQIDRNLLFLLAF